MLLDNNNNNNNKGLSFYSNCCSLGGAMFLFRSDKNIHLLYKYLILILYTKC